MLQNKGGGGEAIDCAKQAELEKSLSVFAEQASFMLERECCKAGPSVGLAAPKCALEGDNSTAANSPQPTRYGITRHRTIQ